MPTYILRETDCDFDRIEADSASDALSGIDPAETGSYDTRDGTVWATIRAINVDNADDTDERTFTIHPAEPRCSDSTHEWIAPHAIVGGLRENPGVWGNGGGVVIREVCAHCGCERVRNTWAHRPDTGEGGLESLAYHPGKYAAEVRNLSEG